MDIIKNIDVKDRWLDYLIKERKLSPKVIQDAGLYEKDGWLAIPVRDIQGNFLFNKYRRAPWMPETLPKYKYDAGSHSTFYGKPQTKGIYDMVICEGELDVLTLNSLGINATSSTSGAGTFKEEEFKDIADHNYLLWYDNDDAGLKGAVKVALILRKFTFVWTPPAWGNDVNDLLVNKGKGAVQTAIKNGIKFNLPELKNDQAIKDLRRELAHFAETMSHGSHATRFTRALIVELSTRITKRKRKSTLVGDGTLERAKSYPIIDMLPVKMGFATYCPFHNPQKQPENSPSFKVYNNNTAYCFGGCQRSYDSIDVYRVLHNIPNTKEGFKRALEEMTS